MCKIMIHFVNKLLQKDGKITDIRPKMRNMSIIWS